MCERVLIVDDNSHLRSLIAAILKSAGFTVFEAVDGGEALDKLDDSSAGLIIADSRLPGMGLARFLREVHAKPAFASVPVLMVTADFLRKQGGEAERRGISGWIAAPFIRSRLLKTVEQITKPVEGLRTEGNFFNSSTA
jgi:two-component system chemotaxis response regulator CheY